jgi:hypothetical protein
MSLRPSSSTTRPALSVLMIGWASTAGAQEITTYRGVCDASAGIALGAHHFVMADDETNVLLLYRVGQPDGVPALDLRTYLGGKEADIEGAALIGDRIYWIASHGRNKVAEAEPKRKRFFATRIAQGDPPGLEMPTLPPIASLLDQMIADERYAALGLKSASEKAPEDDDGLNIEGLAATPDGKLLIGFRNPRPGGQAIVATLENPAETLAGEPALFGPPERLALEGRGIRSLERVRGRYLIVAGPHNDGKKDGSDFSLYAWAGAGATPRIVPDVTFKGLSPEALFELPNGAVHILSDDGGKECKKAPNQEKSFRGLTLSLPDIAD